MRTSATPLASMLLAALAWSPGAATRTTIQCVACSLAQHFDHSDVVFQGKAISRDLPPPPALAYTDTTFAVTRVWKRAAKNHRLQIRTAGQIVNGKPIGVYADAGLTFDVGTE